MIYLHGVGLLIAALGGIVLEQMRQHLGVGQVVDRDDFIAGSPEHLPESQTADAAEAVDCYFHCHNSITSISLILYHFTRFFPFFQEVRQ